MWEIITKIGTPISLMAFVVAVIFKYLNGRANNKINLIKLAPEDKRPSLIEAALETYNLKDDNLTKTQKYDLIKTVLKDKARRFNISAAIFLIITIVIIILSAFIAPKLINKVPAPIDKRAVLKTRIANIVENFNYNDVDRSESYLIQLKDLLKTDTSEEIMMFAFDKLKIFYKSQTKSADFGFNADDLTDPIRELRSQIMQLMIDIAGGQLILLIAPTDFEYLDLANSDLSNRNLSGLSFKGCFLIHVNFEGANLQDCNFNQSFLRLTNFKNSNLKNASFYNADWYNASNLELNQFSQVNRKSIQYLAPTSIQGLIKDMDGQYAFKYSGFDNGYKERLIDNWKKYLAKGSLIETVNSW